MRTFLLWSHRLRKGSHLTITCQCNIFNGISENRFWIITTNCSKTHHNRSRRSVVLNLIGKHSLVVIHSWRSHLNAAIICLLRLVKLRLGIR